MNIDTKSAVLFKNWSDDAFSHTWNGVPYSFASGEEKWMEGWMARHFAKHLTDRELLKRGMETNHHNRAEFEVKCVISSESLPSEKTGDAAALRFDLLNKQKQAETEQAEAPVAKSEVSEKFCDECDSKGVRHKKDCAKNAFASLKKNEAAHA